MHRERVLKALAGLLVGVEKSFIWQTEGDAVRTS